MNSVLPFRFWQTDLVSPNSLSKNKRRGIETSALRGDSSPMKWIQPAQFALYAALLVGCISCTTPPQPLQSSLTLREAMESEGAAEVIDPTRSKRCVVIIRDRHPTYRGYRKIRKQLVTVQRANRRLLDYLVRSDFTLLGCEFPSGPLEENNKTRQSYQLVRSKSRYGPRYLDRFAVYQPVRYQLFWPSQLIVLGVEDPELYEADRQILKDYQRIRQELVRGGLRTDEKEELSVATLRASRLLQVNSDSRGKAAAVNLLREMDTNNCTNAVLLMGGTHVPAARQHLQEAGLQVHVFRPRGYDN